MYSTIGKTQYTYSSIYSIPISSSIIIITTTTMAD